MIRHTHLEGDAFLWSSGPAGILLVHGFTATTAEVRPLARKLHHQGFTVAAPLLPGHGTRPEDLNRVRWQDWVSAAEAVYRRLRDYCDHIFVGGESTGALISLYLASEHSGSAGILTYAPALRLTNTMLERMQIHLAAPFIASVRKSNWTPHQLWQGYEVIPLKGALQLFRLQNMVRARLPQIHQPVLIIQGRLDDTVHPDVPDLISRSVSSSIIESHWMEKTGHLVILDRELDLVTKITLAFIHRCLAMSPTP